MGAVEIMGLAASASLLAGWRLYLTTFAIGLAMRWGWVDLPEHFASLDVLANGWVLGIAGVGAAAEFFADKVMWLDSIWDAVHTVIRPAGGALLALALVDPTDPTWQVASFLLGGGASLMTHTAKAATRAAVNTSPEPFSNILVSMTEDAATTGLLALVIAYPVTASVVALGIVAATVWLLLRLRRVVRQVLSWRRRVGNSF